jgi:hypothetical protein
VPDDCGIIRKAATFSTPHTIVALLAARQPEAGVARTCLQRSSLLDGDGSFALTLPIAERLWIHPGGRSLVDRGIGVRRGGWRVLCNLTRVTGHKVLWISLSVGRCRAARRHQ